MSTTDTPHPAIIHEQDGLILEMSRRFNATQERVFAAFSTLEGLTGWLGPGPCFLAGGEVDFRVGGRYDLRMHTEDIGEIGVGGEYREITPYSRLAFSWQWSGHEDLSDDIMEIVFEFQGLDDGATEMRLIQSGFPNRESAENHRQGWDGSFEKLGPCMG
jgi:uncharacterized protein YndB with AHSA1/START domain